MPSKSCQLPPIDHYRFAGFQNRLRKETATEPANLLLGIICPLQRGDIDYYTEGAYIIDQLTENSRVLIAEACTHAPLSEDIGRVKLPRMLRKRIGEQLHIDIVSGNDFPKDLNCYDLIIHCGACMFNRKHVLNRIVKAKAQGVPMTNYGIVIAYINGIPFH